MSQKTSTRAEQIYAYTTLEDDGEGWNPVKPEAALLSFPSPSPVIHYWPFRGGTFIVVFLC